MVICPECGQDVVDESRAAHAENHWPEEHLHKMEEAGDPRNFTEARRRKNIVLGKEDR